jgi:O-antigen/teichoic acid export membrane protein
MSSEFIRTYGNKQGLQSSEPTEPVLGMSLRKNIVWTLIGNAVYAGCQWGMLMVLAKLSTPETVGQFALALAVTAPVIMLTNLQLRALQATDARQEYAFGHYLGLRVLGIGLTVLALGIICAASGYKIETIMIIVSFGLAKCIESISDIIGGFLQQNERLDYIAIAMMIKGPLSLVGLGACFFFTGSLIWAVLAMALCWALVLVGYEFPICKIVFYRSLSSSQKLLGRGSSVTLRPVWEWSRLWALAWLALPMGITQMLISFNANIPRYFIASYLGERELGFFASMAYLIVAGNMVVNALGQSASPRLAKYYASKDAKAYRNLLFKLLGLAFLLGTLALLVSIIGGRQILTILYRSEYAKNNVVLILLMVNASLLYTSWFLGFGMTAARYFRVQMPLFILTSLVLILTCFLLIPRLGLVGAALAMIIATMVQAVGSGAIVVHAVEQLNEYNR